MKFSCQRKYSPKICIFFIAYFLDEILKFGTETSQRLSNSQCHSKKNKFGSNFVLMKQNLLIQFEATWLIFQTIGNHEASVLYF